MATNEIRAHACINQRLTLDDSCATRPASRVGSAEKLHGDSEIQQLVHAPTSELEIKEVVVVLPDPFRGMWARRKSAETQHAIGPHLKVRTKGQKWKK